MRANYLNPEGGGMKKVQCLVMACAMATVLCLIAISGSAQDQDSAARDQVLALEKAWNQAYKAGDTKALSSILDNSLVLVEDDGSLKTKSEFLASVKASNANEEQVAPESLTVRVFGNTAIAIGVIAVKENGYASRPMQPRCFTESKNGGCKPDGRSVNILIAHPFEGRARRVSLLSVRNRIYEGFQNQGDRSGSKI
jgi:ketosteroid isomerase-like protein